LGEPEFVTDKMTDDELREYRNQVRSELQRLSKTAASEETPQGTLYRVFYCTIYYTPRETGFTADRGFDDTPASVPGLGGRKYRLSFLQAVKREGFGRLAEPVNGARHLPHMGGGQNQVRNTTL